MPTLNDIILARYDGQKWAESVGLIQITSIGAVVIASTAHTFEQRNSTNAQSFRVYGTYTDALNYVRASLSCSTTTVTLVAETAGTGADDIDISLAPAGVGKVWAQTDLIRLGAGTNYPVRVTWNGHTSGDAILTLASSQEVRFNEAGYALMTFGTSTSKSGFGLTPTASKDAPLQASGGILSITTATDTIGLSSSSLPNYVLAVGSGYWGIRSTAGNHMAFDVYAGGVPFAPLIIRQDTGLLCIGGGITSSYPAWKRSSAELQIRLADDSDFSGLKLSSLTFDGQLARTASMSRHTTSNTAGNILTVQAGGATSGATDKNGGYLDLIGGIATGTGESGVRIKGYAAGASGTTDNSTVTVLEVLGNKLAFFAGTPVTVQTVAALTNNVTSGGTDDVVNDITIGPALLVDAADGTTTRNAVYQLARKLKEIGDSLRAYGIN